MGATLPEMSRGTLIPHGAGSPSVPVHCPPSVGLPDAAVTSCAPGRVSLLLIFFLLILGRKPEPAIHKHTHVSP